MLRGQGTIYTNEGSISTYRLIGITQDVIQSAVPLIRENGVNDKGSMIVYKVPPSSIPVSDQATSEVAKLSIPQAPIPKKKRMCAIM